MNRRILSHNLLKVPSPQKKKKSPGRPCKSCSKKKKKKKKIQSESKLVCSSCRVTDSAVQISLIYLFGFQVTGFV
jgi:formylmethanofuran dehydrogenase subunit E